MNSSDEDKKIIIDEDWKAKVQQEKEQAKQGQDASPPTSSPAASNSASTDPGGQRPAASEGDSRDTDVADLPPASLEWLVTSLATQALVALGQVPDPMDGKLHVMPNLAKHQIDMLSMLEEKTRGNLSQDEALLLEDVLHQLRLAYVTISRG
jgi:hypothetical protein